MIFQIISNTLSFIAIIISVLSLIKIHRTLIEMKQQRESSYKPDIYIKSKNFYIYPNSMNINLFWTENPKKEIQNNKYYLSNFCLNIYNIGLGPAKSVRIKWKYNISDIINKVEKKFKLDKVLIEENENVKISINNKNQTDTASISNNLNEHYFNFISPNDRNKKDNLDIPSVLLCLFNAIFIALKSDFKNEDNFSHVQLELGAIEVHLSYIDIGGKIHDKVIYLAIFINIINTINSKANEKDYIAFGEIKAREEGEPFLPYPLKNLSFSSQRTFI